MWLFTVDGFYSIVRSSDMPGRYAVRARSREDLAQLTAKSGIQDAEILATPHRDYPYRIEATPHQWQLMFTHLAEEITYRNFKAAVPAARHDLYLRVWVEMSEGLRG